MIPLNEIRCFVMIFKNVWNITY